MGRVEAEEDYGRTLASQYFIASKAGDVVGAGRQDDSTVVSHLNGLVWKVGGSIA
jgi:hypothetical protein